uniref:Uncharacterized protein n=1 Tax=Globisporangium ultimum (strain ATCC 200006 / CBS 805.95 / DAOM BR144) TaxID=431595 RepID=K3WBA1_GLOUD
MDAWIPGVGGFQVAVGENHEIEDGEDLEKLGSDSNRLFFVLPRRSYNSFTKKNPNSVRQYALLMLLLEE